MILLQGDCLELMDQLPDGSVDMILTDLPYGATANSWDRPLLFDRMWDQYRRVCRPDGAVVLHCQEPFTSALIQSNVKEFRYRYVWAKHQVTGFLNAARQPLRNCEDIAVFYRKQCTYNPQMREGKAAVKGTGAGSSCWQGKTEARPRVSSRYCPTTLLDFPLPRYRGGHPSQKPVALLEYLIRTYTNPGDTVLDSCMGSGSTGVACIRTGRDFAGMELVPEYFDSARARIEREWNAAYPWKLPC